MTNPKPYQVETLYRSMHALNKKNEKKIYTHACTQKQLIMKQ